MGRKHTQTHSLLSFPLYITLLRSLALLRPSSTLPGPVPCLPSLGFGPPHDPTVLLGRRVSRLCLLVTTTVGVTPSLASSAPPLLSLRRFLGPLSHPSPSPFSCLRSRARPHPYLCPKPVAVLVAVPAPAPVPVTVPSLPSLVLGWYNIV